MSVCTCGAIRDWACEMHGDPTTISRSYLLGLEADAKRLRAENERLRAVMRQVYADGIGRPGHALAALVEPLWKALQRDP